MTQGRISPPTSCHRVQSKTNAMPLDQSEVALASLQPRYSKEEFARRGDEIYQRSILPCVEADDEGKFVVIDIETGAYEIDADELAASDRLLARHPDGQIWLTRVGSRYARRFGASQKRNPT